MSINDQESGIRHQTIRGKLKTYIDAAAFSIGWSLINIGAIVTFATGGFFIALGAMAVALSLVDPPDRPVNKSLT
jgi:uncharacterized membrane protein